MATYLKSGEISEYSIQKTVMDWVRLNPKISPLIMHFANEGYRTDRYGKRLKEMGLRPGVADLFIAMQRHGYGGAWIELKSAKGSLRKEQEQFLDDMSKQGYFTNDCKPVRSIEATIEIIKWYCSC